MIARLLLRPFSSSEVGFTHRLFAACLAAEALDEYGPIQELVDCLVPPHSALIRGIRLDAIVPIGLVLSRNADWRKAVEPRDPIAVARSLPPEAPADEREAAARALWDRYAEWGVWIWDRDMPEIAEDCQSLGYLLASSDLDGFAGEIRELITSPELILRGNAIRVLADAGRSEIEPALEAVLRDDDEDAVIRRQAAIAARDLKLTSLLPLIVHRATTSLEDVEVQDCTLATLGLASDEQLFETAEALLGRGFSRSMALSYVKSRLGLRRMIDLLKIAAETGVDRELREKDHLLEAADDVAGDETLDAEATKAIAFAATVWHVNNESIQTVIGRHPEAALEGIVEGIARADTHWWELGPLTAGFSIEQLTEAGLPDRLIENRRAAEHAPPRDAEDGDD